MNVANVAWARDKDGQDLGFYVHDLGPGSSSSGSGMSLAFGDINLRHVSIDIESAC